MAWIELDGIIPKVFEAINPDYDLLHHVSDDDVLFAASRDTPSLLCRIVPLGLSHSEYCSDNVSYSGLCWIQACDQVRVQGVHSFLPEIVRLGIRGCHGMIKTDRD
jgi:hypothetical protein